MALLVLLFLLYGDARSRNFLVPGSIYPTSLCQTIIWILRLCFCRRRESNPGCQRSKRPHYPLHHCTFFTKNPVLLGWLLQLKFVKTLWNQFLPNGPRFVFASNCPFWETTSGKYDHGSVVASGLLNILCFLFLSLSLSLSLTHTRAHTHTHMDMFAQTHAHTHLN